MKHKMMNLDDTLVHDFRCRIEQGELRSGDRIPTERSLAQDLHIHRNTVRLGMARLVDFGLLDVNSRQGYTVSEKRVIYRTDREADLETLFAEEHFLWKREETVLSDADMPEEWLRTLPPGKRLRSRLLSGSRDGRVLCAEQEYVVLDEGGRPERGVFTGWKMDIRYADAQDSARFAIPLLSPLLCIRGYHFHAEGHAEGFPVRFQERKLLPDWFELRAMDLDRKDDIDS